MGTYSEGKEVYNDVKKDRYLIIVLRVVATLVAIVLVLAIFIFLYSAFTGKSSKLLFGLAEVNTVQKDTVIKTIPGRSDTIFKISPATVLSYQKPVKRNLPKAVINRTAKADTIQRNQTVSSGSNAHIITGNGNSVGINGDLINGIKQRHVTESVIRSLLKQLPDKTAKVIFLVPNDKESYNYGREIYDILAPMGYKIIRRDNWMDPYAFDKVDAIKVNDEYQVRIFPSSNVQ